MVALEHSSGVVRARAVEQLSRAISTAVAADAAAGSASASEAMAGEDLSPALLRRLHDEVPEVVLAITNSDTLVQHVLLRPSCSSPGTSDTQVAGVSGALSTANRASVVASAAADAAVPWLSALSEARPRHPVASSGKVLSGLVRLAAAAAAAAATACSTGDDVSEECSTAARKARGSALSLCLECLPGPHANARVKLAQQLASASLGSGDGDDGVPKVGDADAASAGAAAATGKSCKKALRAVGRAAIDAAGDLSSAAGGAGVAGLFSGLPEVLEQDEEVKGEHPSKSSNKKGKRTKAADADAMEVDGSNKSKGLKAMGEEVCDIFASSIVGASKDKSKIEELQVSFRLWMLRWSDIVQDATGDVGTVWLTAWL